MTNEKDPWSTGEGLEAVAKKGFEADGAGDDAGTSDPVDAPLIAPTPTRPLRNHQKAPKKGAAMWLRLLGYGAAGAAILSLAGLGAGAIYLGVLSRDLPDYKILAEYSPPVTTRVYAGDGTLVAEFARERRLFVPVSAIPDHVKYAFISAEDKTFYEHGGLDAKGFLRAQFNNVGNVLRGRRLAGGSTITQQVAKVFLLSSEQKIERKLREMILTRRIEKAFTKDHILELYLNEIYLGNRSYGVAAAALNYFDKALSELTIEEAAYLAALAKGPSNYHPIRNEKGAISRRNWVIDRMLEDGRIDAQAHAAAIAAPLGAKVAAELGARDWTTEYFAEEVRKQIIAQYKDEAAADGAGVLYDGGLAIRTTVNPAFQAAAGVALRRWLGEYDRRHGWRGPIEAIELGDDWRTDFSAASEQLVAARKIADDLAPWAPAVVLSVAKDKAKIGLADGAEATIPLRHAAWARAYERVDRTGGEVTAMTQVLKRGDVILVEQIAGEPGVFALRQPPAVNGALVALDPHTGRVLAMVGGFSFQMSEFNRALQARRQPGSTFKPFVYAAALDNGYTPSSIVLDAPFVAPSLDSWWKPGNYAEGRFYGESTLRVGIEQSRNTMTARLAQDLGIGTIVDYVGKFGLSDSLPRELAISLGAAETTLMRITAAYAAFVNGGRKVEPVLIDRVQDRTGKTIYKRDARACEACLADRWDNQSEPQLADPREQIIDPRTAYQIVSMLEGVVERGTGKVIKRSTGERTVAGKTGTTNEYKDAWFVGFSPDLAAGVYVGFDLPAPLGEGEAGGSVAAPVFGEFMAQALKNTPDIPFRVPSGVRLVRVNAKTGLPALPGDANVILEAFKTEDVIGPGPSENGSTPDPLAPGAPVEEERNLGSIY